MGKTITFQGNPLHLTENTIIVGDIAPDFEVTSGELKPVTLSDFAGKIKVVTTFPSIDTPVCDLQVKEFNKRATALSSDVVVIGVSKDLPFAQTRYCQANGIDRVVILSDYKNSSFGNNFGLLIQELNLLARAVMIIDKDNKVTYVQVVDELANAPDYESALAALEAVTLGS